MLRSRIYNGRSILCLDLAAPVTDLSLTAIDAADHPLLSRDQARGVRFVGSCEPARTPKICGPCAVWVSLDASQDS